MVFFNKRFWFGRKKAKPRKAHKTREMKISQPKRIKKGHENVVQMIPSLADSSITKENLRVIEVEKPKDKKNIT